MTKISDLVSTIIKELTRLETVPSPHHDENDPFPFPRMIGVGDGRSIVVSEEIDDAIQCVADQLIAQDPTLTSKFMLEEWRKMVRAAFGAALAMIDLDDPIDQNVEAVLNEIWASVTKHVAQHGPRESSFGCTLFGNPGIKPFAIGPVRFEPRLAWLERKSSEGAVSRTARRRIEQTWSGKKLKKRKASADSIVELYILDAIGTCPFVCSVCTVGLAPEAGWQRALTTARLALAGIALLWRTPSRALEGMNLLYDRSVHRKVELTFIPGKIARAGRFSHRPYGSWLMDGQWEDLFAQNSSHFDGVAEVLDYVVDPSRGQSRPDLLNALAQALLWFHEGCRESVDLMGIVKFSAALDALACGGKSGGIKRLIAARLGLQETSPILPDGPTMKAAVDEIYGEGRSRTIHGTNAKLGHDWSGTKSLSEQFARRCLRACIDWTAANPAATDPKQLSRGCPG